RVAPKPAALHGSLPPGSLGFNRCVERDTGLVDVVVCQQLRDGAVGRGEDAHYFEGCFPMGSCSPELGGDQQIQQSCFAQLPHLCERLLVLAIALQRICGQVACHFFGHCAPVGQFGVVGVPGVGNSRQFGAQYSHLLLPVSCGFRRTQKACGSIDPGGSTICEVQACCGVSEPGLSAALDGLCSESSILGQGVERVLSYGGTEGQTTSSSTHRTCPNSGGWAPYDRLITSLP